MLNADIAQARKADGLAAVATANTVWIASMREVFVSWLHLRVAIGEREFQMEDFREWLDEAEPGWTPPTSSHVWGAFTRAMANERLMISTGRYEPTRSVRTHRHPALVWLATPDMPGADAGLD